MLQLYDFTDTYPIQISNIWYLYPADTNIYTDIWYWDPADTKIDTNMHSRIFTDTDIDANTDYK